MLIIASCTCLLGHILAPTFHNIHLRNQTSRITDAGLFVPVDVGGSFVDEFDTSEQPGVRTVGLDSHKVFHSRSV